jgi:hypothetical protein
VSNSRKGMRGWRACLNSGAGIRPHEARYPPALLRVSHACARRLTVSLSAERHSLAGRSVIGIGLILRRCFRLAGRLPRRSLGHRC